MRVIFLDIDGVLNTGACLHPNGYHGLLTACVDNFNLLLERFPDAKIVVSSAWRYTVLMGEMTTTGFEQMLMTHGVMCKNRIIDTTRADVSTGWIPEEAWVSERRQQILEWVRVRQPSSWVVLDDMKLEMARHVQTDPDQGLSADDVQAAGSFLRTFHP